MKDTELTLFHCVRLKRGARYTDGIKIPKRLRKDVYFVLSLGEKSALLSGIFRHVEYRFLKDT